MVLILSHRGFHKENDIPENSIPAFERAIKKGADGFEFDLHLTKDNILVCHHDPILKDGRHIEAITYEEITEIDLGKGTKIPTFEEILDHFGNKAFLNIEIKSDNAGPTVVEAITSFGLDILQESLVISSFKEKPLMEVHEKNEQIPTGLLFASPFGNKLERAAQLKCTAIHPFYDKIPYYKLYYIHFLFKPLLKRTITKGKSRGFLVNAWTVNSSSYIKDLLKIQVTSIITDNLEEALKIKEKEKMK